MKLKALLRMNGDLVKNVKCRLPSVILAFFTGIFLLTNTRTSTVYKTQSFSITQERNYNNRFKF